MIGNIIYLVYCEYQNGDKVLQTPHATFDGTRERMEQIKEHWKGQGMTVSEGIRGNLDVRKPGGEFFRHYYVVTMKTNNLTHRYEFGSATVFTRGALGTDGMVRQKFACSVHPVGGGAVLQTEVSAFYAWDAANKALDIYKATQK